jgi:hypothetical protein
MLAEKNRIPHDLDDVVGGNEKKQQRKHDQEARPFAPSDVGQAKNSG